jgi:hypothetical protein
MAGLLLLLAQTEEETGFQAPESAAGWIWFLVFAAVIVGLYLVVRRTRDRHEQQLEERRRREEGQDGP